MSARPNRMPYADRIKALNVRRRSYEPPPADPVLRMDPESKTLAKSQVWRGGGESEFPGNPDIVELEEQLGANSRHVEPIDRTVNWSGRRAVN